MEFFKRISDLATFIDKELHQIEASFQVIVNSGRKYDGPAEISLEIQGEIQDLSNQLDQLIKTGEDQIEHFDGFLKGMIDTVAEFDEKIERIEKYAANYGYVIRDKEKTDLRSSLQQIEEVSVCVSVQFQKMNVRCLLSYEAKLLFSEGRGRM